MSDKICEPDWDTQDVEIEGTTAYQTASCKHCGALMSRDCDIEFFDSWLVDDEGLSCEDKEEAA